MLFLAVSVCLFVQTTTHAGKAIRVSLEGNARLQKCTTLPGEQRFDCVSSVLYRVGNEIARNPDLRTAAQIIRDAASDVGATTSVVTAVAALENARKNLLRATGRVLSQYRRLSTLMVTAKSVLRK